MIPKPRLLALFILLALVPLPFTPGSSAQSTNFIETFETPASGELPANAAYTFTTSGSGTFRTHTDQFKNGAQSYRQTSETAGATAGRFSFGDSRNLCATGLTSGVVRFWFRIGELSDAAPNTNPTWQTLDEGGNSRGMWFTVSRTGGTITAGSMQAEVLTGSGTLHAGIAANTWYKIEARFFDCAGAKINYFLYNSAGTEIGNHLADGTGAAITSVTRIELKSLTSGNDPVYIDDLEWRGSADAAPPAQDVGAQYTSAQFTANFAGFRMDRSGSLGIVRYEGGDKIATLTGTMATGATEDTDCTRTNAVMAAFTPNEGPLVFYAKCSTGAGNPISEFRIRNALLQAPTLGDCGTGCATILVSEFSDDGATIEQADFGEMVSFPIDFSKNAVEPINNFNSIEVFKTAWAFSGTGTRAGYIGVATYTNCQDQPGCDDDAFSIVQYTGATSDVTDVCAGHDATGSYMAVVASGVSTQIYPISWTNVTTDHGTRLRATFGGAATQSGSLASAIGIACGGPTVGIAGGVVAAVDWRSGTVKPGWPKACSCAARGVAVSEVRSDGKQFMAWIDGTKWYVAHVSNGTIVGEGLHGAASSGDTFRIQMDGNAQTVFVANSGTDRRVRAFPIHSAPGGGTGTIGGGAGPGATVAPVAGTGLFDGAGAQVGTSIGGGTFGGNMFLGVLTIAGVAAGFFAFTKGHIAGAIAGVAVGTVLAWGLGFFSGGTVFVLVMLCGGGLYLFKG